MIKHIVELIVPNAKVEKFYDFMVDPDQTLFAQWLPEEHHAFHIVKRGKNSPLGDLIYYDEILGNEKYRLAFYATVVEAERPKKIVFQMRKFGINLPAFLDLEFEQDGDNLKLKHEVRIDNGGIWRIATPFVKHVYNDGFFKALQGHCDREWITLQKVLAHADGGN